MPDNALPKFGDLKTVDILERAAALKLDDATTQMVVAGSILDHFRWVSDPFRYRQPLGPTDPDLVGRFERTFEHDDWTDGESVVQADGDGGFNRRFHQIETDLDGLGREIGRAFTEVAALRAQLASMFEDIRAAFDRLDTRVVEHRPLPVQIDPSLLDQIRPVIVKPPIPGIDTTVIRPNQILELAGQPGEGIAFGKPAKKLSRETFAGQAVDVWSTDAGMVLVPVARPAIDTGTHVAVDPALGRIGAAAGWIAGNDAAIKDAVKDAPLSVDQVKAKFGDVVLEDGTRFGDLLGGAPAGTQIRNPADLTALVTDQQAKSIVSDGRVLDTVVSAIGLPPADKPVSEVGLGSLKVLNDAQRAALDAGGIKTVGQLAAAEPASVATILTRAGVATDATAAGKLIGIGRGLNVLRQR